MISAVRLSRLAVGLLPWLLLAATAAPAAAPAAAAVALEGGTTAAAAAPPRPRGPRPRIDPYRAELSCEDLLRYAFPELCELEVARGSLLIRGLTLVYWRYRARTGSSEKVPVLMVHGGPGFNHQYILPMKQQACRGREVVFYDQVGVGESSTPANTSLAPWLLTIPYYNEEVSALVEELGWQRFHFFGSSWGTVVGQSYGLLQDPRLQAIVLSGPLSDTQLYQSAQWDPQQGNLGSLPPYTQAVLEQLARLGAYETPLYAKVDDHLTSFFTVRTTPEPDCFVAAKPVAPVSQEIYLGMQGPSEFAAGGVTEYLNFTPRLHEIRNPVLLTHGRYDTMRPPLVKAMYEHFPFAWRAHLPRSGHCTMIDEPRLMNDVVGDFLDHAEAGTFGRFQVPPEAADLGELPLTLSLGASAGPEDPASWRLAAGSLTLGALGGAALGGALTAQRLRRGGRAPLGGGLSAPLTPSAGGPPEYH